MIGESLRWPPGRPDAEQLFDETYLGDGVYACNDNYQIWITTGDGSSVALEPSVLANLVEYAKRIKEHLG